MFGPRAQGLPNGLPLAAGAKADAERERGLRLGAGHGKMRKIAAGRGERPSIERGTDDEMQNFCAACGAVPARGLRGQNGAGRAGR